MPRLSTESFGTGDQTWLGSTHGIYNCRTATLDISAFTAGTHYPDGYIPSGTAVDFADEGAVVPYVDGAGAKLGYVYTDQKVSGTADLAAPILVHGIVNVDNLPAAFTAPATGTHDFVFVGTGA